MNLFDTLVTALADAGELESASVREFAAKLGGRPDKFYEMNAGRRSVSYDTLLAIKTMFPRVDVNYLLTGVGDPLLLNAKPVTVLPADVTEQIEDLRYQVKQLTRRCRELESRDLQPT